MTNDSKPTGARFATNRELAQALGCSTRAVESWVAGGLGRDSDGMFLLPTVVEFLTNRARRNGKLKASTNAAQEASAQYRKVKTSLARLELRLQRGDLIQRSQVATEFVRRVVVLKRGLLSLGRVLGSRCHERPAPEIAAEADALIRHALELYSAPGESRLAELGVTPELLTAAGKLVENHIAETDLAQSRPEHSNAQ